MIQHEGMRKQVSLVINAKLSASLGKRRARHAARHQINGIERPGVKLRQITLNDVPLRTIEF
jgi:hypothetical protein